MIRLHACRALIITALILSLAVGGCATTLLYNHADWLIVRQLDGYLDLSRSQKAFLYDRLDVILRNHRHEALPRYETVLEQVRAKAQRGLTPGDLEWAFDQYDQLKTDLFARFALDGADFVRLVNEPQISRLRKTLPARLRQEERLLHDGVEARLRQRTDRILALAKEWLGAITPAQEQEITRLAMQFPDTLPSWYAYQQRRNERLIAVMESRESRDTPVRLYDWLVEKDKDADRAFAEGVHRLRRHITELVLTIDRVATPDQRRYFLAKVGDLIKTIRRLEET
ncbi:MAG TPA: DUF6279 family lipoprotein [Nitrospira sp.]|nr:DUF6279 family lipoprotein [Nitrospira sp.]